MSCPPHFLGSMTLKALLEDPNLKNPPLIGQSDSQVKIKKENGSDIPQYNYGSAFLGAPLWDKSYGLDLNLEYMDLDEFLNENEIPVNEVDPLAGISLSSTADDSLHSGVNTPPTPVVSSPREYLRTPPVSPSQYIQGTAPTTGTVTTTSPVFPPQSSQSLDFNKVPSASSSPPGSPFKVDFQVSEQDLALTNIPGLSFDPRKSNFSEEELKPQPIIKKSKKIFVPDDLKDDKYWARRSKNNYAAKRSRDARRVKENQIALRAAYLEKENKCLRDEMSKLRKENAQLKTIADKYEPGAVAVSTSVDPTWPCLSPVRESDLL